MSATDSGSMPAKVGLSGESGYSQSPYWLGKAAPLMGFRSTEAAKQYLFHPLTGAFPRINIAGAEMVADGRLTLLDRHLATTDALRAGILDAVTNTAEHRAALLECIATDNTENTTTAQFMAGVLSWSEARKLLIKQANMTLRALLMGDRLAADRKPL